MLDEEIVSEYVRSQLKPGETMKYLSVPQNKSLPAMVIEIIQGLLGLVAVSLFAFLLDLGKHSDLDGALTRLVWMYGMFAVIFLIYCVFYYGRQARKICAITDRAFVVFDYKQTIAQLNRSSRDRKNKYKPSRIAFDSIESIRLLPDKNLSGSIIYSLHHAAKQVHSVLVAEMTEARDALPEKLRPPGYGQTLSFNPDGSAKTYMIK